MTQNVIAGIDPAQYTQLLLPQYNDYDRSHPIRWNNKARYALVDFQCWFIRNDSPQSAAVVQMLRQHGATTPSELH